MIQITGNKLELFAVVVLKAAPHNFETSFKEQNNDG